jgi:hypothetical protein
VPTSRRYSRCHVFLGHLIPCALESSKHPSTPTCLLLATPGVVDLPNLLLITPRVDLVFTVKSHRGSFGLHARPRNTISVFTSYHTISLRLPLLSCNVAYPVQGTLARLSGKSIPRFSLGCLEVVWSGQDSVNLPTRWSFDHLPAARRGLSTRYLTPSLPNRRA